MTKPQFAIGLAVASILLANSPASAGRAEQPAAAPLKAGKPIKTGDVLSGELNALRVRDPKDGKRIATYQITTEPRRLPPPNGLCDLVTGPETFQLVPASAAQAAQLKSLAGKEISVKVGEVACAEDVGQISEAIITKWSLVRR